MECPSCQVLRKGNTLYFDWEYYCNQSSEESPLTAIKFAALVKEAGITKGSHQHHYRLW